MTARAKLYYWLASRFALLTAHLHQKARAMEGLPPFRKVTITVEKVMWVEDEPTHQEP